MTAPKVSFRQLKMEDNPDPSLPSSYFYTHFKYFGIDRTGKTIKEIVLELKAKVTENFIRNCHFQPETYDFSEFRLTRTYKLQRDLINYLTRLSSWLYRGATIPPSLKKAFAKDNSFKNPYQNFSLASHTSEELKRLNNLMLSVTFNLNICSGAKNDKLQQQILEEFRKRNIDISEIENTENVLIEVLVRNKKTLACTLQDH